MIENVLAYWTPGPIELLIIVIVALIAFGIPAFLTFLLVRFVIQTNKERRRLRLEVGKLADEVEGE